jgi:hypothetical protein
VPSALTCRLTNPPNERSVRRGGNGDRHDLVPFAKWEEFAHRSQQIKIVIDRINNACWLAHRLFESKARVVNGAVYDIPTAIGPVDVVVLGSILLHLRDPFLHLAWPAPSRGSPRADGAG